MFQTVFLQTQFEFLCAVEFSFEDPEVVLRVLNISWY